MITVYLYTINCDPMTVDKSPYMSSPVTKQGTVRGDVDMLHPEIAIEGDLTGYNYMYIPAFSRYYYIEDVNAFRTQLQTVTGRCDVIMSHKDAILALPAVVRRSALLINSYLPDDKQRVYQYTQCNSHRVSVSLLFTQFTYSTEPVLITAG